MFSTACCLIKLPGMIARMGWVLNNIFPCLHLLPVTAGVTTTKCSCLWSPSYLFWKEYVFILAIFFLDKLVAGMATYIFCPPPATSSHSHRSWCDGLGMGSPCNLVFNHQSATFSCAPRWWDIVVLLTGIAVRFVTHRDPRSPWRLPCRQLPTSLGWLQRGRSWEQEHKTFALAIRVASLFALWAFLNTHLGRLPA